MTNKETLAIIHAALRAFQHEGIDDVTVESDGDEDQIILTTDDGERQVWVLSSEALLETDPPEVF
jgi:hypothetical protein